MPDAKKIYIDIRPAAIVTKSLYEPKLKAKLIKELAKAANTAFKKNSKLTTSKPSGYNKKTDKGFVINVSLTSLTKVEKGKDILLKASVSIVIAQAKTGKMVKKLPSGSATSKVAATTKKLEGEALFVANYALTDLIKKYVIKIVTTG